MEKLNYVIVDVFSQGKYTGNQLAVFKNASNLSSQDMQQIAKEINFSETTFILSDKKNNGGYDVRIFTPHEEVPFAGHPALGTAFVIQTETPAESLILNYQAGQIPVSYNREQNIFWMKQNQPTFGKTLDISQVAGVLNIDKTQIDEKFPIQEVSTGLPVIIVPLKSLQAVKSVKVNKEKYFDLIEKTDAKAIMVFAPETYQTENDLNVRDFADYYGVPEDAATGSANGCLAAYLVNYNYFGKKEINLRAEQGYEIGRPSLLYLQANAKHIYVGGQVEKVAQGEWYV